MPTRNVALTDHQEASVGSLVESGRYQDVGEVLREGLRLVEQREAEDAARLDALRQAVDSGIRDIDEGRFDLLSTRSQIAAYIDEIDASRATVPASPRKLRILSPEFLVPGIPGTVRSHRCRTGTPWRNPHRSSSSISAFPGSTATGPPPPARRCRPPAAPLHGAPPPRVARHPAAGLAGRPIPPRPPDSAANPLARCPERG